MSWRGIVVPSFLADLDLVKGVRGDRLMRGVSSVTGDAEPSKLKRPLPRKVDTRATAFRVSELGRRIWPSSTKISPTSESESLSESGDGGIRSSEDNADADREEIFPFIFFEVSRESSFRRRNAYFPVISRFVSKHAMVALLSSNSFFKIFTSL